MLEIIKDYHNCGLRNIRSQFESSILSIKSLLAELIEFDLAGKVTAHQVFYFLADRRFKEISIDPRKGICLI